MKQAFVLMTAMPPTVGHMDLIRFASALSSYVNVIVSTQPDEPFPWLRAQSIRTACSKMLADVHVHHIHKTLPQEPATGGFWDMWVGFLKQFGFNEGDYIVASEIYGARLAEEAKGIFMPYDLNRSIRPVKAERVRKSPKDHWMEMIPEFRMHMQKRITIFGAESCGKTTVARDMARPEVLQNATWTPEWARPYLETMGTEVTPEKMHAIMMGQWAMDSALTNNPDYEFVIRDTDLYSTIGYWEMYSPETVPDEIYQRAWNRRAHLYVVLSSDVKFVPDPLRYGGEKRESTDQYWIDLLERYDLPYVYINSPYYRVRRDQVYWRIREKFPNDYLQYQRIGAEYART